MIDPTAWKRSQLPAPVENTSGEFSVYVHAPPNMYNLAGWQLAVLFAGLCGMFFGIGHHLPLLVFVAYSLSLALIWLPTAHRPLQYVRYLCKRISPKPEATDPAVLPNGATMFRLFDVDKVAIACEQLTTIPNLMDPSAGSIARFLRMFNAPVEFVITTGCPHPGESHSITPRRYALIMADAGDNAEAIADRLLKCAHQAELKTSTLSADIFEIKASHDYRSSQYIVERLPFVLSLGAVSNLIQRSHCDYTAIVRVAPADVELAKRKARKLFAPISFEQIGMLSSSRTGTPMVAATIRRGAADLLDGRTLPYDISVDISLCGPRGMESSVREMAFRHNAGQTGIKLKHVRTRVLPFLSAFREPPAPYFQTVGEGAAVACCPFFLAPSNEH